MFADVQPNSYVPISWLEVIKLLLRRGFTSKCVRYLTLNLPSFFVLFTKENVVEVLNSYENYERSRRSSLGRRNAYHPRGKILSSYSIRDLFLIAHIHSSSH